MHAIHLTGCTPTPLASYLKALGILRLVSLQCPNSRAAGYWQGNTFVLSSSLGPDELKAFFLERYAPSPVVAPWNGGSGFFPKDNCTAINQITHSKAARLAPYREAIHSARQALEALGLKEKPDAAVKQRLLRTCRNIFPDEALAWLDSAFILTEDGAKYPPLLGTGGNDGRLEFTNNFMQNIAELLDLADANGSPKQHAATKLDHSLFGTTIRGLDERSVGQFSPAASGGSNGTTGFDAKSALNTWDFIFAIEGAILFAAAAIKRLEDLEPGRLAYPFSVQASGSGYGSSTAADEKDARCELWAPLWTAPASLAELQALLSEGRASVGRRAAKNGTDFARAVTSLGVDRGISEFQRYGFHVRNGLAYFATPLQRIRVRRDSVTTDLLAESDGWVTRFLQESKQDSAPASVARAGRGLEDAILEVCSSSQSSNPWMTQQLLIALGEAEHALVRSSKWTVEKHLKPLPPISPDWIVSVDTGDTEFRLAAALASTGLHVGQEHISLRRHLEPVRPSTGETPWAEWDWNSKEVVSSEGQACTVLGNIFRRRLLLAQKASLDSWQDYSVITAWPADISAFIEGQLDEDRFVRLLRALSLIGFWRTSSKPRVEHPVSDTEPPALYAQLKLCFSTGLPGERKVPITPSIFNLAASGNGRQASEAALRRLHGSSIPVTHVVIDVQGEPVKRTSAALLFPLWKDQLKRACSKVAPNLFAEPANL
jgi:CRISPR-associated protein Csx17